MSPKKDPSNTSGPDADPSDAFKDALSERAAADVAQSLANGGRVLETVFSDPIVRAALDRVDSDQPPGRRELKEAAAKAIETNDALLRQPGMDDDSYWASGAAPKNLIMKFQMSRAHDADTSWRIDAETKTIEIMQETIMGNAKSFITTAMLLDFVLIVLPREGIVAYNDETTNAHTPVYTDWKLIVNIGDVKLRAVVWKQSPFAGAPQATVELYPVAEA